MKKPRKQYKPNKHRRSDVARRIAVAKAVRLPTDDLDLLDEPQQHYQQLLAGKLDNSGYVTLCEMAIVCQLAGRLLLKHGTGSDTADIGRMHLLTGDFAISALCAIGDRWSASGRFGGSAEQYRDIKASLDALVTIIPVLTRGELVTILIEAADIVEDGLARAKKQHEGLAA